MSTYNSVVIAGAKGENTVWGWGRVRAASVGVPQNQGNVREFYVD